MPRKKPEPTKNEVSDDEAAAARDAAMARLGGAAASLSAARDAVLEALGLFVNPEEDEHGAERGELMEAALEAAGAASRGIEQAMEDFEDADAEAGEPWEDSE